MKTESVKCQACGIAADAEGGLLVHGMGASNVRDLRQIVDTAATLNADETKPQ
jgi:hypothetical protein